MCHTPLLDASFHAFLLCIDEDLVAETRAGRCQRCGGALHKRRYPRKPRGGGLIDLGRGSHFRLSLACSKCSKRHTPPSVRFMRKRVYLAAVVVLASALRSGLTGSRAAQLTECLRVPRRTIERWRTWWLRDFVKTSFWRNARAQFMPPLLNAALPASLVERFERPDLSLRVVAVLRFLTPLDEER